MFVLIERFSHRKPGTMSQPPVHGAQPAQDLQKKYEFVSILGAGGFGKVYLLRHKQTNELRAVKSQVLLKPLRSSN